ncbi:MAG: DnaA/Hda family protein [Alphaproteobacteria bacterium]
MEDDKNDDQKNDPKQSAQQDSAQQDSSSQKDADEQGRLKQVTLPLKHFGDKIPVIKSKPQTSFYQQVEWSQTVKQSDDADADHHKPISNAAIPDAIHEVWKRVHYCLSGEQHVKVMQLVFDRLSVVAYQDGMVVLSAETQAAYQQMCQLYMPLLRQHFRKSSSSDLDIKDVLVIKGEHARKQHNDKVEFTQPLHKMVDADDTPLADASNDRMNDADQGTKAHARTKFKHTRFKHNGVAAQNGVSAKRHHAPNPFANDNPLYDMYQQLSQPLNARYVFDHFLEDEGTVVAYSAGMQMAHDVDGELPNPLVIYGDTGCGKTHVLHALAQEILSEHPESKILCCSGNIFKHQFAMAVQNYRMTNLREMVRNMDVLLFDDVHHLPTNHKVVEEFLHIITEFRSMGKRVILTCCLHPAELREYPAALMTRLKSGLTVKLDLPSRPVCFQLLTKEAKRLGLDHKVSSEALQAIVVRTPGSIREMAGMLNSIHCDFQYTGKEYSVTNIIDHIASHLGLNRKVKSSEIMEACCKFYKVTRDEFLSRRKSRHIALCRHVAMYLLKSMTTKSYPEIARDLGNLDHTTVMYGVRKITKLLDQDPALKHEVEELTQKLKYNLPDIN